MPVRRNTAHKTAAKAREGGRQHAAKSSIARDREGYEPRIDISGESGESIDENMLLEAMPDFIPLLPHE